MLGILITGHGHFATGMGSAVRLLAGEQEAFELVDFEDGDSTDRLAEKITAAFDRLADCESILVCTDIIGGSPFKTAATLAANRDDVHVIAGTSVAVLLTAALEREDCECADDFVETILEAGHQSLVEFKLTDVEDESEVDGI